MTKGRTKINRSILRLELTLALMSNPDRSLCVLANAVGHGRWRVAFELAGMERAGQVVWRREDGPWPGHRLYRLAGRQP